MTKRNYRVCYTPEAHKIKIGHIENSEASQECQKRAYSREQTLQQKYDSSSSTQLTPQTPTFEEDTNDIYDTSQEYVLILTRGLPSSGKTTWAKQWVAADPQNRMRINRDDLRVLAYGEYIFDPARDYNITKAQYELLKTYLFGDGKKSVIMDNTLLNMKTLNSVVSFVRTEQIRYAAEHDGEMRKIRIVIKDFPLTLEEALERNIARGNRGERTVPSYVVEQMFKKNSISKRGQLQKISDELTHRITQVGEGEQIEQYSHNDTLERSGYIVDIDGTLAYIDKTQHGYRSPYELTRVLEDKPNQPVIDMVQALKQMGKYIIVMSGREDICYRDTQTWLEKHHVPYDELHMRKAEDRRADHIVKWEMYNTHVKNNMNVEACIDDRNQVVSMYRSRGLKVFQVAPGDF